MTKTVKHAESTYLVTKVLHPKVGYALRFVDITKRRENNMKLIKTLIAIILTEIVIAIPILVGIYVWSMVAFV